MMPHCNGLGAKPTPCEFNLCGEAWHSPPPHKGRHPCWHFQHFAPSWQAPTHHAPTTSDFRINYFLTFVLFLLCFWTENKKNIRNHFYQLHHHLWQLPTPINLLLPLKLFNLHQGFPIFESMFTFHEEKVVKQANK